MRHASLALLTAASLIGLSPLQAQAAEFTLSSPSIAPGSVLSNAHVFKGFGCTGDNVSPALNWAHAPKDAKSFAVTVYDPDAPTGSGWWHWVVYNIPASATGLSEGAGNAEGQGLPVGSVQGRTDFGAYGFGGACPPVGDAPHRYIFTVHALKTEKLELPKDATAALVGYMLNANLIAKTSFQAQYSR